MQKTKLILLALIPLLLTSCGSSETSSNSEDLDSNTISNVEDPTSSNDITPIESNSVSPELDKFEVNFASSFEQGYQYDTDTKIEEFKTQYFNTELVSSIKLTKVQVFQNSNKDLYHTIQLGSAKYDGEMLINFSKGVSKIELEVVNYYNCYKDYSSGEYTYNIYEANFTFKNNDSSFNKEYTLESQEDLDNLKTTKISLEPEENITSISIQASRVLLVTMNLYY